MGRWFHGEIEHFVYNVGSVDESEDIGVRPDDKCDCAMHGSPL